MDFIEQLYKYTDNTRWGLEKSKENAREFYKCAAELYRRCPDNANFEKFIAAKRVCMGLGVII